MPWIWGFDRNLWQMYSRNLTNTLVAPNDASMVPQSRLIRLMGRSHTQSTPLGINHWNGS
ncbi:MAG: hypothetical protein MUF49_15510 [Oculatellaceae cyanobacterium Prado106]|nr:hypothetical protein [Oculatellaceae cyanobacterium Prado106]